MSTPHEALPRCHGALPQTSPSANLTGVGSKVNFAKIASLEGNDLRFTLNAHALPRAQFMNAIRKSPSAKPLLQRFFFHSSSLPRRSCSGSVRFPMKSRSRVRKDPPVSCSLSVSPETSAGRYFQKRSTPTGGGVTIEWCIHT